MRPIPISSLPGGEEAVRARIDALTPLFDSKFGKGESPIVLSAPGRIEVLGNHTDHNGGKAVAAAVGVDILCLARARTDKLVNLYSVSQTAGVLISLSLGSLSPDENEKGGSAALIRGVAAYLKEHGREIGGFDAVLTSDIRSGSGLSSSAAFTVCVCAVFDALYNGSAVSPLEAALAGRYSENVFFGKPCGLMDQIASAFGGFVSIDFRDPDSPDISLLPIDLLQTDYSPHIVHCRSSHGGLTNAYARIPIEMKSVAAFFGKERLIEIDEDAFFASLPAVRTACGDRAVMRTIHFFDEDRRVERLKKAIGENDKPAFLSLIRESGLSSGLYLQNLYRISAPQLQPLPVALALCSKFGDDVYSRVHGGGFAGTILAFVSKDAEDAFRQKLDGVFGEGSVQKIAPRARGGGMILR